jgi:hypothetical protein
MMVVLALAVLVQTLPLGSNGGAYSRLPVMGYSNWYGAIKQSHRTSVL